MKRGQTHATLNPPENRRLFVAGEVMTGAGSQQGKYLREVAPVGFQRLLRCFYASPSRSGVRIFEVLQEQRRNLCRRQDRIRVARLDQAQGHRGEFGSLRRLGDTQAADRLDSLGSGGAVDAGTG